MEHPRKAKASSGKRSEVEGALVLLQSHRHLITLRRAPTASHALTSRTEEKRIRSEGRMMAGDLSTLCLR